MRIGLIDVDGHNYPNLPLMKLSAWHKEHGDHVEWYDPMNGLIEEYDKVYMSKVFSFTPDYNMPIYAKEVQKGGSGYCIELEDGKEVYHAERDQNLPYEIEHIYPDYSLYPEQTKDTAYGFLTRGCPRGCGFCHVKAKEGQRSYKVADLSEFWNGQKKIVLCDPNLLAYRGHIELLQQLVDSKATVDFNQGMDIRLINEKNMELIKQIKLARVHFAFDRWQDRDIIKPRLKLFSERCGWNGSTKRNKVSVYILTNFDTTIEQDLDRIMFVGRECGFQPYPMIYDKEHADEVYKRMQRWCSPYIFWTDTAQTFADYTR